MAVNAYGFYMICGILSIPEVDVNKEEIAASVHKSLSVHWKRDNWAVLNGLLIMKEIHQGLLSIHSEASGITDIFSDISSAQHEQWTETLRIHHPDFTWDRLDQLVAHYERLL